MAAWWNSLKAKDRDGLEATVQGLATASAFIGNEIVIATRGRKGSPIILAQLTKLQARTAGDARAQAVFTDLLHRARAYRAWCGSLRTVCAWGAPVYGYLESTTAADKKKHEKLLQSAIDLELVNTAELIDVLENTPTEVMVLSSAGNNTFFYGEDLPQLLREKIRLMKKYRNRKPRIDRQILWRQIPGAQWPKFE